MLESNEPSSSYFKDTNTWPGCGSVNLRDQEIVEKLGEDEHVSYVCFAFVYLCVCARVCVHL